MDNIPYEILQKISLYLDNKSLCNLLQTNKKINNLQDGYFWQQKCKYEYRFNKCKRTKGWKEKYISLYKKLCICCFKRTRVINKFFNQRICRSCEKSIPKYHCISHRKATREYFLSKKDLSGMRFINRNNPFNSNYPLKLYLKSDILDYIKNEYGFYHYNDLREQKINSRSIKSISFLTKFNILNTVLMIRYRIDIPTILPDINRYTKNLYIRYLRKNSNSDNEAQELIKKCLQLDFISRYTNLDWEDFDTFDDLLLYHILTTKELISYRDINDYILEKIKNLSKCNRDKISRKIEVIKRLPSVSFSLPVVFDYIYKNAYNLDELEVLIILENFLLENTDIEEMIMFNILNNISFNKKALYISQLKRFYHEIPSGRDIIPYKIYRLILV